MSDTMTIIAVTDVGVRVCVCVLAMSLEENQRHLATSLLQPQRNL